jgi:glycosyltransferase involved in cell wall biosynthesis
MADHNPRVSVLMAAHDAHATIVESVSSALAQTMTELEVVVVDDGSARPIAPALAGLAEPRLRVLRTARNLGVGAARTAALRAARAPIVAQLDADDLWRPDHLAALLGAFADPRVGLAYTNAEVLGHPRGATLWIPSATEPERSAVQCSAVAHPVGELRVLLANNPIPAPGVAMRRAAALAVGGYPAWLRVGEDYMLYVNLMRAGWRFAYLPRPSAVYRWPEPGRGATYDRRRHARQETRLFAALARRMPAEQAVWRRLSGQVRELIETHVPAALTIAKALGPRSR